MVADRTAKRSTSELVDLVMVYALEEANYTKGWDIIAEATSREELAAYIGNATTLRGAIYKVNKEAGIALRHSVRKDIEATAF